MSYDKREWRVETNFTVSIPLEQGSVLRRVDVGLVHSLISSLNPFGTGQCLTTDYLEAERNENLSQSLWNRAVSYDCSGVIKPCATRPAEATSQLFPRLRELGLDLAKF